MAFVASFTANQTSSPTSNNDRRLEQGDLRIPLKLCVRSVARRLTLSSQCLGIGHVVRQAVRLARPVEDESFRVIDRLGYDLRREFEFFLVVLHQKSC